ncbi:MAG: hypothetical protein EBT06_02105 [Gammaproteobacteria bacterium]|nr:hypothetical protein [Gammaproteobacteria bacterium]
MLTDIPLITYPHSSDIETPRDIDGIIVWLSTRFQELEEEGREVVDEYWRLLRVIQKGRSFWPRMTLGLRIRTYSIKTLLRRQPTWVAPLVLETETLLADIRCRLDQLIKIRDALGAYARKTGESAVTPSKLLENYRLEHQLKALL